MKLGTVVTSVTFVKVVTLVTVVTSVTEVTVFTLFTLLILLTSVTVVTVVAADQEQGAQQQEAGSESPHTDCGPGWGSRVRYKGKTTERALPK